jgi:hypothetical protein
MGNDANLDAVKGKVNPRIWLAMKADAISKGQKIHEWIEDAIIRKLSKESVSNEK